MKVTQVAIRPTEESNRLQRPALTPELLAASGARYSRNNEGLDSILSKIDPENLDKSVDSIFRMIDYGHQSIADMAPVAMFIDGISLYLAYHVWSLCPTASGQESSTRYINYGSGTVVSPEVLGIPEHLREDWNANVRASLQAYEQALAAWEKLVTEDATVARIPRSLIDDPSDRAQKQVARMRRNYGFDRARNFLPVSAPTNVMLLMSARGWVQLCQQLASSHLNEAQLLAAAIADELKLASPRLLKHAVRQESLVAGNEREWKKLVQMAQSKYVLHLASDAAQCECPPHAQLEVNLPPGVSAEDLTADLEFHQHRYAWIGENLKRTTVRFSWDAIALAEIRDLNRHRTGTKWCPLVPQGFYASLDQWPGTEAELAALLQPIVETGRSSAARAHELLAQGETTYIYWTTLGTQYKFEHVTTADKFIYEAELRTGTGSHYRYATHLRDVLALWYKKFPATKGLILEGSAEPE